ncbi:MAG: GDP-mannose 4,6-dehydratase [Candidatus Omnitrophica bacterium]|nr:GDP-mannose 4,6-dehydratase [Candidatus Omnitrophota bacterium]
MRRVLVTGGAGFIGSHVVDALVARGDQVRVLDDFSTGTLENLSAAASRIDLVRGDVGDPTAVRRAMDHVTHVVHEAAIRSIPRSLDHPALCHQTNATGTLNVLLAAREAHVARVVLASSSAVYGNAATFPAQEDQPLHPGSPYAVSKLVGELYAQLFRELYRMEIVCLRYFNAFGPRMDGESGYAMAIPRFSVCVLRGESPPVYGDGLQSRDFLYVENIVQATLQALDAAAIGPGVFNVAGGRDYTLLDTLGVLNRIAHRQVAPRHLAARMGEARRTFADITRAKTVLGFSPSVSFEEGLARTVAWFREQEAHCLRANAARPSA